MYAFTYEAPGTTADAAALAAQGGQYLAGGQSLLPSMRLRLARRTDRGPEPRPGPGRHRRQRPDRGNPRHDTPRRRGRQPAGQAAIPALAELAGGIGDRQVRARGTIGGSLANNDPAACYPSAVLGLGATVVTDRREIAADDFFQGMYTTALGSGELITAVRFPVPRKAAYLKFKQPASRFALVGVFVAQTDSGVRVAITGAGLSVFRHVGLEAALNQSFTPDAAAQVLIDHADLNSDLHASARYRAQLISVQTQRAVSQMLG